VIGNSRKASMPPAPESPQPAPEPGATLAFDPIYAWVIDDR
jgi:hypothetical protein